MSSIQRFISDRVDTAVRRYMQENDCDNYSVAMHEVLAKDPALRASYAGVPVKTSPEPSPSVSAYVQRRAGDELNEMALDLLAQSEDVCDYSAALKIVMAEHPELTRRYTHG